jgi:hypothetical protein
LENTNRQYIKEPVTASLEFWLGKATGGQYPRSPVYIYIYIYIYKTMFI